MHVYECVFDWVRLLGQDGRFRYVRLDFNVYLRDKNLGGYEILG
jgi:hypothetical protein